MVMVDFYYVNAMTRKGSFIMLDDVQLHSVKELARLLAYDPTHFKVRADLGKALIFEKMTDQRQLGEWNTQPYICDMTKTYLLHPTALLLWRVRPMMFVSRLLFRIRYAPYLIPQRLMRGMTRRPSGGRHR